MEANFNLMNFLIQSGVPKEYAGDLLILACYIIASIIVIILVKKRNLGAFVLSSYVAYVIFSFSYFIPKAAVVGIIYFGLLIVATFMLMKKIVNFHIGGGQISIILQSLLIALLACGMITSFVLRWLPPENMEFFTPFTKQLLTSDIFQLGWVVVPFLLLAIAKKYRY